MSQRVKFMGALGSVVGIFLVLILFWRLSADDLSMLLSQDQHFAIRLALQSENPEGELMTEALGQMIIYPPKKRVLLYFVNTDARYEEDGDSIRLMSPGSADQFKEFTDLGSRYAISIQSQNLERLLDLNGGMHLFVEEPLQFDQQNFSYPQGRLFMAGKQIVEYMLARRTSQPDRAWLSGVERLRRLESMLLNLFWQKERFQKSFAEEELYLLAQDLFDTNLPKEEFDSLLSFLADPDCHIAVREVPLAAAQHNRQNVLLTKTKSARIIFKGYTDDVSAGRDRSDRFPVEVLNGTDVGGLARRVKQYLQDRGLQVLEADNYRFKPLAHSMVVERSGDTWTANYLMEITALKSRRVVFQRMPMDIEASFIIGSDFKINQLKLK